LALRALQRDTVELEPRAGLLSRAHQVGRVAVQAHHPAQVLFARVQDAVAVQVLAVPPTVPTRAVRALVPRPVDATGLGQAALAPHPELIGLVSPDLAARRVGLLVQDADAP